MQAGDSEDEEDDELPDELGSPAGAKLALSLNVGENENEIPDDIEVSEINNNEPFVQESDIQIDIGMCYIYYIPW